MNNSSYYPDNDDNDIVRNSNGMTRKEWEKHKEESHREHVLNILSCASNIPKENIIKAEWTADGRLVLTHT